MMVIRCIFILLICLSTSRLSAASFRTQNFIVRAATAGEAEQIGIGAEKYRKQLAVEWLGSELPPWSEPCPIRAYIDPRYGPSGETSFEFQNRRPVKWKMRVIGPLDRVLDSILPHEVTHTIFATHFGRRLPPWADEGVCTFVEANSQQEKLRRALHKILLTQRRLSFDRMFALEKYPHDIVPLYTQGHSLASYLIASGGKEKFVRFLNDGMKANRRLNDASSSRTAIALTWALAIDKHYGYATLAELESHWFAWVQDSDNNLPTPLQSNTVVATSSNNGALPAVDTEEFDPVKQGM